MKLRKIKKYIRRQQRLGKAEGRPAEINCGLYWFIRFALKPAGGVPIETNYKPLPKLWEIQF